MLESSAGDSRFVPAVLSFIPRSSAQSAYSVNTLTLSTLVSSSRHLHGDFPHRCVIFDWLKDQNLHLYSKRSVS